jgi:hypothetical protein
MQCNVTIFVGEIVVDSLVDEELRFHSSRATGAPRKT